jgi:hypothetical protein
MTTYAICVALFIPSVIVFVKTFRIKDKFFLMMLSVLLIIGELAGIATSYCIEEVFKTAIDL